MLGLVLMAFVPLLHVSLPADAVQIRLVGGNGRCSGRVEVYHSYQWGTVCDYDWDMNDAAVVCRELGCGTALSAPGEAHFGQGTGDIWMDNVRCSGSESSLSLCSHRGFGKHNCNHGEDAGAVCSGPLIRLFDGKCRCSGRVEVYQSAQWGTVCDDVWDMNDAAVVCRELGCGTALSAPGGAHFGQGTGKILMTAVGCSGNESSLSQCSHRGFGSHNCDHGEDAGAVCSGAVGGMSQPTLSLSSTHSALSPGDEVRFRCVAPADLCAPAKFQLHRGGAGSPLARKSVSRGTSVEMGVNNVDSSHQGSYTCLYAVQGSQNLRSPHSNSIVISVVVLRQSAIVLSSPTGEVTGGPQGPEVIEGHSFTITCSTVPQYPGGSFYLSITGSNVTEAQAAVNHFASFIFSAAELSHQGNYSCVYETTVSGRKFSSPASSLLLLTVTVVLQQPAIVLSSPTGEVTGGPQGPEVIKGHSFTITCSTVSQYPGGSFYLSITGSNVTEAQAAVNHSASFIFSAAELSHQGNYSCVYETTVSGRKFSSPASPVLPLTVTGNPSTPPARVCIHGQNVSGLCLCLDEWTGEFCQIPNVCNGTTINGFTFNKTVVGRFSYSSERCVGTANAGFPLVSVQCLNKSGSPGFGPLRKLDCGLTLDDLQGNITGNSVIVSNTVLMLTSQPERLTPDNITSAAAIVTQLLKSTPTEEVAVAAVATISQLLSANIPAVGTIDNSATNSLTSQLESFSLPQKKGASLLVQPNLVVQTVGGLGGSRGVEFSAKTGLSDQFVADRINLNTNASQLSDDNMSALGVQIFLRLHPDASGEDASVGFVLYQNDLLFQSAKFKTPLGTTRQVISASMANGGRLVNVEMRFRSKKVSGAVLHDFACMFWNYSVSDWSTAGCRKNWISNVIPGCVCNHTTNFALLMSFRNNYAYAEALNWISIVGCSLSIIGVTVTIIFQIFTRRSRKANATLLPVSICFSLLVFYLLFLFGIQNHAPAPKMGNVALLSDEHSERDSGSCTGITALLHYFLLATFTWNTLFATYILLLFLFPLAQHQRPFTIAALVTGWGLPAAVVAVTLGATYRPQQPQNYRQEEFCWLAALDKEKKLDLKKPMIWGFLLPVALLLLFNCVVYVYFMVKTFRPDPALPSTRSLKKKVLSSISLSVVLGLSWVLGYLLLIDVVNNNNVISIMFCILTTTQGLQFFILHTARTPAFKKKLSKLSIPVPEFALHNMLSSSSRTDRITQGNKSTQG